MIEMGSWDSLVNGNPACARRKTQNRWEKSSDSQGE